jgi:hypothetical protein
MYQSIRWVFDDKDVKPYLDRELQKPLEHSAAIRTDDELRFPAPLVALMIAYVARRTLNTRDGHILGKPFLSVTYANARLTLIEQSSCLVWTKSRRS